MKKTIIFWFVCVIAVVVGVAGFANGARLQPRDLGQDPCSVESKDQYLRDFEASHDGVNQDQAKALEAAKKYLNCPDDLSNQETLATLNLAVGRLLRLRNSSSKAIPYLIKAASYTSLVNTSPQTYFLLAAAYEEGPYAVQSEIYKSKFEGKETTDESLLALENICLIIDRIIDAYARALALAGVVEQPEMAGGRRQIDASANPTDWMDSVTDWYKFRHNGSDDGLKELIATILSQPLPPEPAPLTSMPSRAR